MQQQLSKILILFFIAGYITSCNTVKRVADDEHLLTENTVYVNDKKTAEGIVSGIYIIAVIL